MQDSTEIRIGVVVDVDVMQRLGDMAKRRNVSVSDVISSILSDATKGQPDLPDFLEDDVPTDIVTPPRKS